MNQRLYVVLLVSRMVVGIFAVLVLGWIIYRISTSKTLATYITRFRLRNWD